MKVSIEDAVEGKSPQASEGWADVIVETLELEGADFEERSGFRVWPEWKVLRLENRHEAFMRDTAEEVWHIVSSIESEVMALRKEVDLLHLIRPEIEAAWKS